MIPTTFPQVKGGKIFRTFPLSLLAFVFGTGSNLRLRGVKNTTNPEAPRKPPDDSPPKSSPPNTGSPPPQNIPSSSPPIDKITFAPSPPLSADPRTVQLVLEPSSPFSWGGALCRKLRSNWAFPLPPFPRSCAGDLKLSQPSQQRPRTPHFSMNGSYLRAFGGLTFCTHIGVPPHTFGPVMVPRALPPDHVVLPATGFDPVPPPEFFRYFNISKTPTIRRQVVPGGVGLPSVIGTLFPVPLIPFHLPLP